jgi:hypothetical protein
MDVCSKCGRPFYPRQDWIHEPQCRYVDDVEPNHVPLDKRGVWDGVTPLRGIPEKALHEAVSAVTERNANAERQRRYRERQKAKAA